MWILASKGWLTGGSRRRLRHCGSNLSFDATASFVAARFAPSGAMSVRAGGKLIPASDDEGGGQRPPSSSSSSSSSSFLFRHLPLPPPSPASPSSARGVARDVDIPDVMVASDLEDDDDEEEEMVHASTGSSSTLPELPSAPYGILVYMSWALGRLDSGQLQGLRRKLCGKTLRVATLCSGIEVIIMVMVGLSRAFQARGMSPPTWVHETACEIDDKKRSLCQKISPNVKHVYKDLLELSRGPCYDYIDGRTNEPGECDMLHASRIPAGSSSNDAQAS